MPPFASHAAYTHLRESGARFTKVAESSKGEISPGEAKTPTVLDRAALFEANLSWAAAIAQNVHRKLPPCFDIQDLEQVARIEMWKRSQLYDPQNERGAPFKGYAHVYIRGAVLMSIRRKNWIEANHESLTADCLPPQVLNTKGVNDGRERWSIGTKVARSGRDPVDQRENPEQQLISTEAGQAEEAHQARVARFFSEIPPPVPEAILLLRIVCVEGVGIDELARSRRLPRIQLVRKLNVGLNHIRKLRGDGILQEIGEDLDLGKAHVN
jgi:hypothetical protein